MKKRLLRTALSLMMAAVLSLGGAVSVLAATMNILEDAAKGGTYTLNDPSEVLTWTTETNVTILEADPPAMLYQLGSNASAITIQGSRGKTLTINGSSSLIGVGDPPPDGITSLESLTIEQGGYNGTVYNASIPITNLTVFDVDNSPFKIAASVENACLYGNESYTGIEVSSSPAVDAFFLKEPETGGKVAGKELIPAQLTLLPSWHEKVSEPEPVSLGVDISGVGTLSPSEKTHYPKPVENDTFLEGMTVYAYSDMANSKTLDFSAVRTVAYTDQVSFEYQYTGSATAKQLAENGSLALNLVPHKATMFGNEIEWTPGTENPEADAEAALGADFMTAEGLYGKFIGVFYGTTTTTETMFTVNDLNFLYPISPNLRTTAIYKYPGVKINIGNGTLNPLPSIRYGSNVAVIACNNILYVLDIQRPGDGGGNVPSGGGTATTPGNTITAPTTEAGWTDAAKKVNDLKNGAEFTIDMKSSTTVSGDFLEAIAGKDVNLTFDMGGGVSWTVNGKDIPEGVDLAALNLAVTTGTTFVPAEVRNIDGSISEVQLRLSHNGELPFAMTLIVELDKANAGSFANLYYYNPDTGELEFLSAVKIAADGTVEFDFDHASDYLIVVAKTSLVPEPETPWQNPFTDVKEADWFYEDVKYAVENGLFAGNSAITFSPNTPMTRGMLVTVLGRMEGVDIEEYAVPSFDDTPAGEYYAPYVSWAAQNNIVAGYNAGTFGPDDNVTREQFATILYRYAKYKGIDVSVGEDTNILSYNDAMDVSEYAIAAMQWACGEGVITGKPGDLLDPRGSATRAEAAAMLHRFLEK